MHLLEHLFVHTVRAGAADEQCWHQRHEPLLARHGDVDCITPPVRHHSSSLTSLRRVRTSARPHDRASVDGATGVCVRVSLARHWHWQGGVPVAECCDGHGAPVAMTSHITWFNFCARQCGGRA